MVKHEDMLSPWVGVCHSVTFNFALHSEFINQYPPNFLPPEIGNWPGMYKLGISEAHYPVSWISYWLLGLCP